MKTSFLSLILAFYTAFSIGQEVILNTDFSVRDFKIKDNTLVYIEKRDIKSLNLLNYKPDKLFINNSYFIGGYGLNIFYPKDTTQIVTSSNELVRDVGSIRFYDLKKKEVNKYEVYYTTEMMDFLLDEDKRLMFLSKKNKTIEIIKFGTQPRYKKLDSIMLDSYARKLKFHDNKLYYITDSGKVFKYDINFHTNKILYKFNNLLVNFICDINYSYMFITTYDGKIFMVDLKNGSIVNEIKISNSIIEAIEIVNNKYIIVGDWNGMIFILDFNSLNVKKQYNNKKRIIKIVYQGGDFFYSSSSDKKIKKWKLN